MARILAVFVLLIVSAFGGERDPAKGIVFCAYNLKNWVGDDQESPKGQRAKPKTDAEKDALLKIVAEIQPDILGVCEMGSRAQFDDFLARLKPLGLLHSEYVESADPDRHLALVSRFPIVARDSKTDVRFMLGGAEQQMRRGILDVTLQVAPEYRLRCVGAHLKSKLPIAEGEAVVRRHEAAQLRAHLDRVFAAQPGCNLLCYGDFNDTKNTPVFHEVLGPRNTAGSLTDLAAKDDEGERWTHFWKESDQYSRIDYLFASPSLVPEIQKDSARIFRSADWSVASDHRPVFVTIVPVDK